MVEDPLEPVARDPQLLLALDERARHRVERVGQQRDLTAAAGLHADVAAACQPPRGDADAAHRAQHGAVQVEAEQDQH